MKNSQSFPPLVAFLKEIFAFLSFLCCIPKSIERYSARRRLVAHGSANYPGPVDLSGCSSGVEHNLAKVGVEGSNPFARSKFLQENRYLDDCHSNSAIFVVVRLAIGVLIPCCRRPLSITLSIFTLTACAAAPLTERPARRRLLLEIRTSYGDTGCQISKQSPLL